MYSNRLANIPKFFGKKNPDEDPAYVLSNTCYTPNYRTKLNNVIETL